MTQPNSMAQADAAIAAALMKNLGRTEAEAVREVVRLTKRGSR